MKVRTQKQGLIHLLFLMPIGGTKPDERKLVAVADSPEPLMEFYKKELHERKENTNPEDKKSPMINKFFKKGGPLEHYQKTDLYTVSATGTGIVTNWIPVDELDSLDVTVTNLVGKYTEEKVD